MKALMQGGPAEGALDTQIETKGGQCWTIIVTHVNCACDWCSEIEGNKIAHLYERNDNDVFVYRESKRFEWEG